MKLKFFIGFTGIYNLQGSFNKKTLFKKKKDTPLKVIRYVPQYFRKINESTGPWKSEFSFRNYSNPP